MSAMPLEGVRIADFTWVGVGPFATKFLADFGADVIKIESTLNVDVVRKGRPFAGGQPGLNRSGYFANRNSSKRSVTVNLKNPEGLILAKDLIRGSDVVINNFSSGVMEKFGLHYAEVSKLNSEIVYVDMPMQGMVGPHSGFRGYGAMINALSGLYASTGLPGRRPIGTGTNYPDHVPNPLHAAIAIVAALEYRSHGGGGRYIEISQLESTANVLGPYLMEALNATAPDEILGNNHAVGLPQWVLPCRNEEWCALPVRTDEQLNKLFAIIGMDPLQSAKTSIDAHQSDQSDATSALKEYVARWLSKQTAEEAMTILQNSGIPAGKVKNAKDLLNDPQLMHRGHWVSVDHPEMGKSIHDGPVAQLKKTPARLSRPAPLLGQHTREVMLEVLNLKEDEFERLRLQGVFT